MTGNLSAMDNQSVELLRHSQQATNKQSTPQDEVDKCDRFNHRGIPWAAIDLAVSKILELLGGAHWATANTKATIANITLRRSIIASPCRVAGLLVDLSGLGQMPRSSVLARSGYRSVRVIVFG
jgi:hypothetical protein